MDSENKDYNQKTYIKDYFKIVCPQVNKHKFTVENGRAQMQL